jgi:hypothetical protein
MGSHWWTPWHRARRRQRRPARGVDPIPRGCAATSPWWRISVWSIILRECYLTLNVI